ncbi:MAG: hypothetical protein DSY42_06835 [Aquifex sp.]|nr:MAG: hypothetical protein DSY42_06835 [Aquifex sp.]
MISGDLKNPQDLLEVLSGIPQTKSGYLNLLSKNIFLSLKITKSTVEGFFSNIETDKVKNPLNALIFILSELLYETEGYFSFEEETAISGFREVKEDIESLVIKSTILRREIDEILPLIITTNVEFKSELPEYNKKTLFEVLTNADDVLEKLRELKKFLEEGKVEISEIKKVESIEEIGIDYILESVEYKRINLLKILESLKVSNFTGFVEIEGKEKEIYTFFKNGEIFGIYPVSVEIFDYFMEFYGDFKASIIKLNGDFIDTFAQAFIGKPIIASESKYISLGKLFLTLLSLKENGIVKIVNGKENYIYVFREGKLLSAKKTDRWDDNWRILFPKTDYIFLFKDIYVANVNYLFYLFLLNKLKNLIVKYSLFDELNQLIFKIAEIPSLYIKNGRINTIKVLSKKEEKELLKIFITISEKVIEKIGKETFERELEEEVKPYKDILKILNLSSELYTREEFSDNLFK